MRELNVNEIKGVSGGEGNWTPYTTIHSDDKKSNAELMWIFAVYLESLKGE